MKIHRKVWAMLLIASILAGTVVVTVVALKPKLSTSYKRIGYDAIMAESNILPARPYVLESGTEPEDLTLQEFLAGEDPSVEQFFSASQYEEEILSADSLSDVADSRAEVEGLKSIQRGIQGLREAIAEGNLPGERLNLLEQKIGMLLRDKSSAFSAYSGPLKGTWTTPDKVLLRWAPEQGWIPEKGYDLYRTAGGKTEKIASGLGSQMRIEELAKIDPDFASISHPLFRAASLDAAELKQLGFASQAAADKALFESATLNSQRVRISGALDFALEINKKISIPANVLGRLPQPDRFGNTALHFAREIRIWPSALGSAGLLLPNPTPQLPQDATRLKFAELVDARNTILTMAFTDDTFALQSGFGYEDNLEAAPGIPAKAVISYMVVPVEGENETLSAADIAAGKSPKGAFRLALERGAETLVEVPAGLAGYGIDDQVSLRWDSPKTNYAKSIIVGYYIERQKKGESEFTRITETPVAISYSEDELGILYETPSYYIDLELKNGEEASYRIQALDVFGRISGYSNILEIKVYKVTPPQAPHLGQPELSSQVNSQKSEAPYQDITISNKAEGVILPITSLSADTAHFVIYRSKAEGMGFFDAPEELVRIKFEPYAEARTPLIAKNRSGGKFLLKPRTLAQTDILYFDNTAVKGCYYRYWVAAVDSWGNESPWSESKTIGFPLEKAPAPPKEASVALEPYKIETDKLLAPGFYRRFNKLDTGNAPIAKTNYLGFSFSQAVRQGLALPKSLSLILNNLPKGKDIHDLIALDNTDILPDGTARVPWHHYGGEGVSGYTVYRTYADNVSASALGQMSVEELIQGFEWKLVAENIKVNQIVDKVATKEGRLYLYMICLVPKEVSEPVLEGFETYVPGGWLRVNWLASEDSQVKYYRVYRAEVDYFTDKQDPGALDWQMVGDNLKNTCYSEKVDQTYAHYYYFKVTSVSTWGVESASGPAARFRVPATSPPQAPAMLVPFSKKEVNQVNWVGVPHASKYVIYRHTVPRITQADLISVQAVAPSLFDNLFSPKLLSNIYFAPASKLKMLPGLKLPGQDPPAPVPALPGQLYALGGKLNTLKLKTPAMIRQNIEKADMSEKLDMYSEIVKKHGVLAVAPYGSLDLSTALNLLWTSVGEINIAEGQDSTGEMSFFDETAVFGETYLYTVQAFNDDNLGSDRPDPVSVLTRKSKPFPAVTGLKFKAVDCKAEISWNAAKDPNLSVKESQEYIAGYILYRSNEEKGTYYQASAMLPCNQLSYTDPNVNLTSENWYVVRVVDTAGFLSDFSQPLHATVPDIRILPKTKFKLLKPNFPIGGLVPQNPDVCAQLPTGEYDITFRADSIARGNSTALFVPITPPIIKPPDLIRETMTLNGFTISQIKITNVQELKGAGILNIEGGYKIPVAVHVKQYSKGVITEGTAVSEDPVALGNTGVFLKSVNLDAARGKSLATGYVMRDAGNIMGDMRILAFEDSQISPAGVINIAAVPVFHYENLTFTGISKTTINLNLANYTGVPVLNKPVGNITVPTLVGNCFINLHEGTAETNMGLETMDNKGLEFKFTLLGFDAQGRLSGDLALNGEQYMRTIIPAGLGIKAASGALAYRAGGVDVAKSSLAGKVLTPFLTFNDEASKDPIESSLIHINAAQINSLARPLVKPSSLSAADISVLNNGLNYYAGLAQSNSLLVALEKPAALTTVSYLPFTVSQWDGNGFLLQDTSMTPVCIGQKPFSFGALGDEHVDALGATPDRVAIDLSKTEAYAGEGPEDIKMPSWMGIIVKKGNVSLPLDYIKSPQGKRIRFNLTAGELLYDRNGFFYQNQVYTPEGVPASFGDALGGFTDVTVKNVAIDLYNNKTNFQITGELAVPLFNSRLKVKLYTDEKVQKQVCTVSETEKLDPSGNGAVKVKILNGYLDPLGLHVDGTLDFAIANSIAFEDIQFNDLLLPADWSKLAQEDPQSPYGRALFDKPYKVDFHDFPMEVRALSVITRMTGKQITNANYAGPAYDTTMTLWGSMQLADNLPLDTNRDVDRIVIGNVFADPAVEYTETKSLIDLDFEDFAQFKGVGTPKLADSGDGIVEFETKDMEMLFNGALNAFSGMPLKVNSRFGYDRQKERSFFAIALFYGREESTLPRPPGIPLVYGALNDITGVIGYNLDMPKNPDGTYNFPKEKTGLFNAIDTMAVSKSSESNYFMAMSACLYMGYGGLNLGEVRDLYLVVEKGPCIEMGGSFYGPDSPDDFISADGEGLKLMGEAHLGYYHPQRLFKFSLSLYDVSILGLTASGDIGFEMCPSYWELRLGYPEALKTNVYGTVAWFGLGIRSSDIDQSFIKAQAGFGYDTGDVAIGIVYVRGYLYAGGDGEYIIDEGYFRLHVFVEGGIEGGIKVKGKRFQVINLMLRADGTLVKSDSWTLDAQARIRYCVDLWLTDISGSVGWHISTSF